MQETNKFQDIKYKLDQVGKGFCLAKWTQVTMHLHNGLTHSCHHPTPHKIPLSEIKNNPSALHNTKHKKYKRKEMLEGKRPAECEYCWKVEDNSKSFSDRVFKSEEPWSQPFLEDISNLDWRENYNPKYVEVAFSNACNFKCSYCGPMFSSKWIEEIEKFGGYPTTDSFNSLEQIKAEGKLPYKHSDENPYVDAFWEWWPDLYRDLHTFRITGGEPLLAKDTWKVLDYIIEHPTPNKNLHLAINSNLGVPDNLIDRFIEKINKLEEENRVSDFVIFTSVDGWGKQAEYGRHGLDFDKFWKNIDKILSKCPTVTIGIMCTYNVFSILTFDELIKGVYEYKKKYSSMDRAWNTAVSLDTSFLRYPSHQTVQILPKEFSENVNKSAELAKSLEEIYHTTHNEFGVTYGFSEIEITKIKRIYDWMLSEQDEKTLKRNRFNFYKFVNEHDKRRGINFLETFPEYKEFYDSCKDINL
jgi:organic radical activating enzyme